MSQHRSDDNKLQPVDAVIDQLAEYVVTPFNASEEALMTARLCTMDALACGMLALQDPHCPRVLGPVVDGAIMSNGCLVPGTNWRLDPVRAAFNLGALVRWLDFNDTWLAAEWGHPSDNLGGLMPVAAYLSQLSADGDKPSADSSNSVLGNLIRGKPATVRDLLTAMVQAYEIQGVLALANSFNRVGLDHVLLVRVATAAVTTAMLGGSKDQVVSALTNAFADGGALRTYRHAPNTGSRKSWAAGDATSRGVWLALMALRGEMEYRSILSAPKWGFSDVLFDGKQISLQRDLGCYVAENILFKVSYPAEFHAQTAVEAAVQLHPQVAGRLDEIEKIELQTQESAVRIISKSGPLHNPADRDHCLQYMVAIGLLHGDLVTEHYEDECAADPRIDRLRQLMLVSENPAYTKDYLDPDKRAISNAIRIHFNDGTATELVEIHYPLGHRRRRQESIPVLHEKFQDSISGYFPTEQSEKLCQWISEPECFDQMLVHEFVEKWQLQR